MPTVMQPGRSTASVPRHTLEQLRTCVPLNDCALTSTRKSCESGFLIDQQEVTTRIKEQEKWASFFREQTQNCRTLRVSGPRRFLSYNLMKILNRGLWVKLLGAFRTPEIVCPIRKHFVFLGRTFILPIRFHKGVLL